MNGFWKHLKTDREPTEPDCQNGNAMTVTLFTITVYIYSFEGKTRETMFKQSIRIQNPTIDTKEELEKLKEVSKHTCIIYTVKLLYISSNQMKKNDRTMNVFGNNRNTKDRNKNSISGANPISSSYSILSTNMANACFSELKQIQNEKRRLLVETETQKLKDLDDSFKKKFDSWRDKLGPRKQASQVDLNTMCHPCICRNLKSSFRDKCWTGSNFSVNKICHKLHLVQNDYRIFIELVKTLTSITYSLFFLHSRNACKQDHGLYQSPTLFSSVSELCLITPSVYLVNWHFDSFQVDFGRSASWLNLLQLA